MTWLVVHLYYLIGFENRLLVLLRWAYSFFSRGRGTRLITEAAATRPLRQPPVADARPPPGSIRSAENSGRQVDDMSARPGPA